MRKKKCTCNTKGVVKNLNVQGLEFPTKITVEYEVEGQKYEITEGLAMEFKTIKLGFLPIGQKKIPKVNSKVGSIVNVNYNPDEPSEAYIVGNDGLA